MRFVPPLRRYPFFWLFILCWSVVHLGFQSNFWFGEDSAVFAKYAASGTTEGWIEVGSKVYYTKATWQFLMVALMVLGFHLVSAMAISYAVYSAELLLFFPPRIYSFLNVLLAVGMVVEVWIKRPSSDPELRRTSD